MKLLNASEKEFANCEVAFEHVHIKKVFATDGNCDLTQKEQKSKKQVDRLGNGVISIRPGGFIYTKRSIDLLAMNVVQIV